MDRPRLTKHTPLFVVLGADSSTQDVANTQSAIAEVLRAANRVHHFLTISEPKHTETECRRAAQVAQRQQGAVIVVGGDRVIHAGLNATLPTGRPFGIVPLGASRYAARRPDAPLDPACAVASLLMAQVLPQQVGYVNNQCFLLEAAVGLFPEVLQERAIGGWAARHSRAAPIWPALALLWRSQRRLVLELRHGDDHEIVRTPTLLVDNDPCAGPLARLDADDEQHRLTALAVLPLSGLRLFGLALRGALDRIGDDEHVRKFAFRRLTVRPRWYGWRSVEVVLDGEVHWLRPPLVFSVASYPLMLMVPARTSSVAAA